jgi:hypothetical protein
MSRLVHWTPVFKSPDFDLSEQNMRRALAKWIVLRHLE